MKILPTWKLYRFLTQPASRAFKVVYQVTMTDNSAAKMSIPFDGKQEHYEEWSSTFIDYCTIKKCNKMIIHDQAQLPTEAAIQIGRAHV